MDVPADYPLLVKIDTTRPDFRDELSAIIDRFDPSLICVDYFDTLVRRTIAPEDVKRIACERISRMAGSNDRGSALYAARSALEVECCRENEASGKDLEFTLPALLERLWHSESFLQDMTASHFIQEAVETELSIECSVQILDHGLVDLLHAQKRKGRRIVLASDFYIPLVHFKRMLERMGILDLFDHVYISSDALLTKRSGRLFDTIIDAEGIQPSKILMIGDNIHSDGASANSRGIPSIWLNREHQHAEYAKLSSTSGNHDRIESRLMQIFRHDDRTDVFGELSLTLYAFIDDLFHRLKQNGARDVFFMAREGQLLRKLFKKYQDSRGLSGESRIRPHYFKVSRRATFLPSLRPVDEEDFFTLFRQYRRISIAEFLGSLGLDGIASTLRAQFPYSLAERQEDLPTSEAFAALLSNSFFRDSYEAARLTRQSAFRRYLESFGADFEHVNGVHFVDVGWKGTIQDNLRNIFDLLGQPYDSLKITGHYLGLIASGNVRSDSEKSGVIFSCIGHLSRNFHVFNENRALFEVALGADHGSAQSYEFDPDSGTPIIKESEFEEAELFASKIRPLQRNLKSRFQAIDDVLRDTFYPRNRLLAFTARQHARMVLRPRQKEIHWFENVYHVENFGVFEASTFGKPARGWPNPLKGILFYLKLRKHPAAVDLGFWPWLKVYQQGGSLVALRYANSRFKLIGE
ncbi:HAD family hydrolase [Solilutibacter silvestris]|uniref:HAD family hydrolase n=1 Tax=Solilutibacter silvestris TaxID=1645665 RepID=UPI003D357227